MWVKLPYSDKHHDYEADVITDAEQFKTLFPEHQNDTLVPHQLEPINVFTLVESLLSNHDDQRSWLIVLRRVEKISQQQQLLVIHNVVFTRIYNERRHGYDVHNYSNIYAFLENLDFPAEVERLAVEAGAKVIVPELVRSFPQQIMSTEKPQIVVQQYLDRARSLRELRNQTQCLLLYYGTNFAPIPENQRPHQDSLMTYTLCIFHINPDGTSSTETQYEGMGLVSEILEVVNTIRTLNKIHADVDLRQFKEGMVLLFLKEKMHLGQTHLH